MQIVVQGLMIHYQRVGKGRPILLLHGWGDSSAGLTSLTQQLAKTFDVVVPDLPGFGGSQMPNKAIGLSDYAQIVSEFVSKLGITPVAVIGHSNGGAIALRAVGTGLLKPKKLILLGSAGIRGEYKGRNKVLRMIAKTGKLATYPLPHTVKKKLRNKLYTTIGSDMLVAEQLQETFKQVVSDDVREDAKRVHVPTLLIYGSDDVSTPVKYGKLLHEAIQGSDLQIVEGAEHFVHIDKPDQTLHLITEFLR